MIWCNVPTNFSNIFLWVFRLCVWPVKFELSLVRPFSCVFVCVCVCGSPVHDKLVQFQACRGGRLIFVSLALLLLWPFFLLLLLLLVSPQIWIGKGATVCSPSDSVEIITVQPSPLACCYISPLIRLLRGVVDQLRSLYPDHSTTATPPFGDMINKRWVLRRNNTVICYQVLFVSFSSLPAPRLCLYLRRNEEKVKVADGENTETSESGDLV